MMAAKVPLSERINLRRHVLAGLNKVRLMVQPLDVSLATLDLHAGLMASLMRLMGLRDDPTCQVLVSWVQRGSRRLRRLGPLGD